MKSKGSFGHDSIIAALEELAKAHNIEIRKGKYDGKSGLGKYKGNWVLLIDRSLEPEERVELLTDALIEAGVPIDELPPEVRTLFTESVSHPAKQQPSHR